jgi:hypothetical protein
MLAPSTTCYFDEKMCNPNISVQGAPKRPPELFKKEMNLEKLGIGGLNVEVSQLFYVKETARADFNRAIALQHRCAVRRNIPARIQHANVSSGGD